MFDFHISAYDIALAVAAYCCPPIAVSLVSGIACAVRKPQVSGLGSAFVGAGIGLLGSLFLVIWGFGTLSMAFGSGWGGAALVAVFFAGPVAVSIGCAVLTWRTSSSFSNSDGRYAGAVDPFLCR